MHRPKPLFLHIVRHCAFFEQGTDLQITASKINDTGIVPNGKLYGVRCALIRITNFDNNIKLYEMLKRLKTTAQCAIQNVRRSFTFHFNDKHNLYMAEVKKHPDKCHVLVCDCGEEFTYLPHSDCGRENVGAIVDRYGGVWQYVRH